jgi:hypothetical protein
VLPCTAVAKRSPDPQSASLLRRKADRITIDALSTLRESVQRLEAAHSRHEDLLTMTFRRIADIQAQMDVFAMRAGTRQRLGKKR